MVVEAHKETHITLSHLTPEELIVQGHGKRPKLKLNLLRHVWLKIHRYASLIHSAFLKWISFLLFAIIGKLSDRMLAMHLRKMNLIMPIMLLQICGE